MADEFQFDVFLSHSSKDKSVVCELAARLKKDGVRVCLDEEQIKPGDSIPARIEDGLEHSRVLVLCMSANAFGSDWAQLEAGTFRFRDPLNRERRFIPLRLDDAPIKGSLAQFLYINWCHVNREEEYAKLRGACQHPVPWPQSDKPGKRCAKNFQNSDKSSVSNDEISQLLQQVTTVRRNEWNRLRADFEAQAKLYPDLKLQIICIGINGAFPKGEYNQPNYMINLWQYYGDGNEARNRLATSEFTKVKAPMAAMLKAPAGLYLATLRSKMVEAHTASSFLLPAKVYAQIKQAFPGVNDDHSFQRLLRFLAERKPLKVAQLVAQSH